MTRTWSRKEWPLSTLPSTDTLPPRHHIDRIIMTIDLSDDEKLALAGVLKRAIEDHPYPLSPRVRTFQGVFAKIGPPAASTNPYPAARHGHAPPSWLGNGGEPGEILARPVVNARRCGQRCRPFDRVVRGLRPPGRARSRRTRPPLWAHTTVLEWRERFVCSQCQSRRSTWW